VTQTCTRSGRRPRRAPFSGNSSPLAKHLQTVIPSGAGRLAVPRSFPMNASACAVEESLRIATVSDKAQFQAIRGTRDLLPDETALWNRVQQTAREVFATFNFGEICTPIFESSQLFARSVGGDTDIVSKEMYILEKPLAETRAYMRV